MIRFKNFLTEMPALHPSLGNKGRSNKLSLDYKEGRFKPLHVIEDNYNYAIFSVGTVTQGEVYLINKLTDEIEYEMNYVTDSYLGMRGVTQYYVWRNPHGEFTQGIVKKVFFDYLLKHYKVVFSDRDQTKSGIELWYRLIPDAIQRNHEVGFFNLYEGSQDWYSGGPILPWIEKHQAWSNTGVKADNKVFAVAL